MVVFKTDNEQRLLLKLTFMVSLTTDKPIAPLLQKKKRDVPRTIRRYTATPDVSRMVSASSNCPNQLN